MKKFAIILIVALLVGGVIFAAGTYCQHSVAQANSEAKAKEEELQTIIQEITSASESEKKTLQDKIDDLLVQLEDLLVEEVVVFDAAPIQEQILEIGELATVAYRYTNVGTLDSSETFKFVDWTVPFSKKTVIATMDGVLKAGIEMKLVEISTDEDAKTIAVHLPQATILSNELDENSLVVYEEEDQLFSNITIEDSGSVRCQIKDKAEEKALEYDLLTEAREKAGDLIRNLIEAVPGVKDTYTIIVV